uniref:Dynein light chain roadblock n=2 Tax=Tetraselmis sp. GSL018 TaxID=582737 RepID=A0A061RIM5_9CHLO
MAQSEVDSILERIREHKGVKGYMIVDNKGKTLRTTFDGDLAQKYNKMIPQLAEMARSMVRDLDPQNDLEFLRIRSHNAEIMVAPRSEFCCIVVQDPMQTMAY